MIERYELGEVIESMPELSESIENKRNQVLQSTDGLENLLPTDRLVQFIEYVSDIDLAHYINTIAEANCNIMPENL